MPVVPGSYWHLLDRATPPVKRRATHAKTRTGCLTCKRRKVKCDEAKPNCARCIKSGHSCTGYDDGKSTTPSNSRSMHAGANTDATAHPHPNPHLLLRPRPPTIGISGSGMRGAEPSLNLTRASLTPTYLAVRDALYFDRFKCQMLVDLGAWCGAEYWRHAILREVLLDKTIQHAAFAGAAMLMDIEQQRQQQQRRYEPIRLRYAPDKGYPSPSDAIAEEPSTNSTGTAIRGELTVGTTATTTRGIWNTRKETQPIVPLSNASTDGKAALRHYTTAIHLCRQGLAADSLTSSNTRSSLTVAFLFVVFELVQGNVGEADRLLTSGASLLDHALSRLNPDGNPALVPDDALREIQLAFDRMRLTWDLCPYFGDGEMTVTGCRETTTVRHFEVPSLDAPMRIKQVFWNAFSSDFAQFMATMRRPWGHYHDFAAIHARRTSYLSQLSHWLPILEDLYTRDPGSALLCTTKAYAQTAIVFLNCFLDGSELAYDAYLPTFRDIVSSYQRLLSSEQSLLPHHRSGGHHLRLTLDVDLFHIITFTVSKCRDRETRTLALNVFGEITRCQVLWANSALLAALQALADLEGQGRDPDGFVPASARYYYSRSEWDFHKRQMTAVFLPVLDVAGGEPPTRITINF